MNKVYLIAPLLALGIFSGVYVKHARAYQARLDETEQLALLAKKEKAAQQAAAQEAARREAVAAIAQRKAAHAEKEHLEEAQKQARREAEQRRLAAAEQEKRLRLRLDRLKADVTTTSESLRRSENEIAELEREQVFLADYVRQADANRNSFYHLLERLEIIERERLATVTPPAPRPRP